MTDETPKRPISGTPGEASPDPKAPPTPGSAPPAGPAPGSVPPPPASTPGPAPGPGSAPAPGPTPAPGSASRPGSAPAPGGPPAGVGPAGRSGVPIPNTAYSGDHAPGYTPPPKRTSAQIRADIEAQRAELGQSVDHLRDKVTELTDWRGQIRKHRKKIVVGAVATGFVVGGLMALRRR